MLVLAIILLAQTGLTMPLSASHAAQCRTQMSPSCPACHACILQASSIPDCTLLPVGPCNSTAEFYGSSRVLHLEQPTGTTFGFPDCLAWASRR